MTIQGRPVSSSNPYAVSPDTAAPSVRPPRVDLFGPIHKTLRLVMGEALVGLGRSPFEDARAAEACLARVEEVLVWCERHLEHEDAVIAPAARERLPGGPSAFDEHGCQGRAVAELRAQIEAVRGASAALRPRIGTSLYLHFSRFVGENLVHMAEEEQVLMPLLGQFFDDVELRELYARILARRTDEERATQTPVLVGAISPAERRGLVESAARTAPLDGLLDLLARASIEAGERAELVALVRTIAAEAGGAS